MYVPNVTLHQDTLAMNFSTCSYVFFKTERIELLLKQYHTSPSTLKLHTLLNISSGNIHRNVCILISKIMNSFLLNCNSMITCVYLMST